MSTRAQDHAYLVHGICHRNADAITFAPDLYAVAVVVRSVFRDEGRERHHDPVIATLAQSLAFFFSHADDRVRVAVNANLFADGIGSAYQILENVVSDYDHLTIRVLVGIADIASVHNIEVVDAAHGGSPAANLRVRTRSLRKLHHAIEFIKRRADYFAFRAFIAHSLVIVELEILALLPGHVVFKVGDDV